jgi:hypothetical protein
MFIQSQHENSEYPDIVILCDTVSSVQCLVLMCASS